MFRRDKPDLCQQMKRTYGKQKSTQSPKFCQGEVTVQHDFWLASGYQTFDQWLAASKTKWARTYSWHQERKNALQLDCEREVHLNSNISQHQFENWLGVRKQQWRLERRKRQRLLGKESSFAEQDDSMKVAAGGDCESAGKVKESLAVPEGFTLPSVNLFTAWRHWLIGFPDFKIKNDEGGIMDCPIRPLRLVNTVDLPQTLRKKFKDGWRPILVSMSGDVAQQLENTPASMMDEKFIAQTYNVAMTALSARAPAMFTDSNSDLRWKVATWSRKIRESHKIRFSDFEGDNINILSKEPIPSETIPIILNLIDGRDSSGQSVHDLFGSLAENEKVKQTRDFFNQIVLRNHPDSIKRGSIMTLQPNEWLNDEIMNYFCKNIISPTSDDIGIFSSYFFTRLTGLKRNSLGELVYHYSEDAKAFGLGTGNRATTYKESRDIFKLKELYVPINKDNNHWLHLRVIFESKRIELRDSLGYIQDDNLLSARRKYLADMKRYLFDEYHRSEYAGRHTPGFPWEVWDAQWSCIDLSSTIPRQENGDDCGVFTLIAISLLAQGITLTKNLYSQSTVDSLKCRLKIAYLLWIEQSESVK